ncbi:MAG: hypothetical protein IT494_07995 [Gammaproteobacteria bacterium]|nr:hypothetical protein [Gammaproteobacteria bacterium]
MNMSPGMNRFAALSLALLTLLALIFYGVMPLATTYRDNAQSIAMQQRRLATYESLLDNASEIDAAFASATGQGAQDNVFLSGENPALASANLRALVNGAVQASGGVLITSQDYQAQTLAGAQAIGLRLQVNCEIRNLVDLLYRLEQARPLVVVEALTVGSSAMPSDRNARGPAPGADPNEAFRGNRRDRDRPQPDRATGRSASRMSLDVRLDIVGYLPMRNP